MDNTALQKVNDALRERVVEVARQASTDVHEAEVRIGVLEAEVLKLKEELADARDALSAYELGAAPKARKASSRKRSAEDESYDNDALIGMPPRRRRTMPAARTVDTAPPALQMHVPLPPASASASALWTGFPAPATFIPPGVPPSGFDRETFGDISAYGDSHKGDADCDAAYGGASAAAIGGSAAEASAAADAGSAYGGGGAYAGGGGDAYAGGVYGDNCYGGATYGDSSYGGATYGDSSYGGAGDSSYGGAGDNVYGGGSHNVYGGANVYAYAASDAYASGAAYGCDDNSCATDVGGGAAAAAAPIVALNDLVPFYTNVKPSGTSSMGVAVYTGADALSYATHVAHAFGTMLRAFKNWRGGAKSVTYPRYILGAGGYAAEPMLQQTPSAEALRTGFVVDIDGMRVTLNSETLRRFTVHMDAEANANGSGVVGAAVAASIIPLYNRIGRGHIGGLPAIIALCEAMQGRIMMNKATPSVATTWSVPASVALYLGYVNVALDTATARGFTAVISYLNSQSKADKASKEEMKTLAPDVKLFKYWKMVAQWA